MYSERKQNERHPETRLPPEREYGKALLCSVEKQILSRQPLVCDNTLSYLIPGMLQHFDYDELM